MRNFYFYLLFLSLSFHSLSAQNPQQSLVKTLQEYHSIPKEVAYLHMNKTVLLQGEQLGFSAYMVKKSDLTPSKATSNLYVQVKNEAGEVVKQILLLVNEGVASNVIAIDTSFVSGEYTITAFTNWMRNFKEQNYFTESFRVISSNLDHIQQKEEEEGQPDVQFLPESGHLLSNAINTIGVVVKDKAGYGLLNATLMIKDGSKVINRISLNRFGIGRFTLIPEYGKKYSAVLSYQGKEIPVAFNTPVVSEGIILSAVQRNKELRLLVSTNAATSAKIKNRPYFLVVQNRRLVEAHELRFGDRESIPVILDLDYLESGMNIFTLLDEDRKPIAERLFFNYEGLPVKRMKEPQILAVKDSLQVKFSVQDSTRISVSILPQKTLSYNRNHSIVSYNMLQPYVKGTIEDGSWYFTDITEEKKYELDNLLLTQGWSSYNWESIFNFEEKLPYPFEEGIVLKGILNTRDSRRNELKYMVHATENSNPMVLEIPSDKDAFIVDEFQPVEGEQLFISRVKNNDKLLPAGLSVQFYPSAVPYFNPHSHFLPQKSLIFAAANNSLIPVRPFESPGEELGEVFLETTIDKVKDRERKLGAHSYGKVHVIKDNDIPLYQTLAGYLRSKGLYVAEDEGTFAATSGLPSSGGMSGGSGGDPELAAIPPGKSAPSDGVMAVYLDGVSVMDHTMFYQYPLASIDYIEIEKWGLGSGFTGNNGSIKIYSSLQSRYSSRDRTRTQQFDIPLAYSSEKQYYVPKYENEDDSFFQSYGVIDWIPSLSSEGGENMSFIIKRPEVDFQMIIEGFTADGTLICDVKTVSAGE